MCVQVFARCSLILDHLSEMLHNCFCTHELGDDATRAVDELCVRHEVEVEHQHHLGFCLELKRWRSSMISWCWWCPWARYRPLCELRVLPELVFELCNYVRHRLAMFYGMQLGKLSVRMHRVLSLCI